MTESKIIVCCHKDDIRPSAQPYMPLHVGKARSAVNLGFEGDNTGDNISHKNNSYCELTGMYWAWKNLKDVEVVGLCHYRRYFDFHGFVPCFMNVAEVGLSEFNDFDLTLPETLTHNVSKGKVVVARAMPFRTSIMLHFCYWHFCDDLRILRHIFLSQQSDRFIRAFEHIFSHNNSLHPYNMFLMRWEDFDRYCSWLFPILEEMERQVDINKYDTYQGRLFGFVAERLFNVWLYAEKKGEIIEKPIVKVCDNPKGHGVLDNLHALGSKLYCNMLASTTYYTLEDRK